MLEEFDLVRLCAHACVSKPGPDMWHKSLSGRMSIVLSEVTEHEFCLCVPVCVIQKACARVNRRELKSVRSCIHYSAFSFYSSGWSNLQPERYHKAKAVKVQHALKHTRVKTTSHKPKLHVYSTAAVVVAH